MRVAAVGWLLIGAVATGCGEPDGPQSSGPTETAPSATAVYGDPFDSDPLRSVQPSPVTEPCPWPEPFTGGDADGQGMLNESGRLEPMLGYVLQYASQFPDSFDRHGLMWHGPTDASAFVSFAGDIDGHRAALGEIVDLPDELVVCQSPLSGRQRAGIMAALADERLQGGSTSSSSGVEVRLNSDQADKAAELIERYSTAVSVTVGALPYPLDGATSVCPEVPVTDGGGPISALVRVPTGPLTASFGDVISLEEGVAVTNTSDVPLQFSTGTAVAVLVDSGGSVVSDGATVPLDFLGIEVSLAPGETQLVSVVASVASCDPRLGYRVPAGEYELIATVQAHPDQIVIVSDPTMVTIA